MADGWIELVDVETDEAEVLFVFDRLEPVDYGHGGFLLVEVAFFGSRIFFAGFAYLGFHGVDDSAGRLV